jgi:hypothetical protein
MTYRICSGGQMGLNISLDTRHIARRDSVFDPQGTICRSILTCTSYLVNTWGVKGRRFRLAGNSWL